MSVDVLAAYGPVGKLVELPGGQCPDWCDQDEHLSPPNDDGVHCSAPLAVELSTEQEDQADYVGNGSCAVLVNVQWHPGDSPFVMLTHHDGMVASEDPLTPGEAEKIAWALEKNASIIRACENNTCWCDGLHSPEDIHWGECERTPISLTSRPYTPDVCVAIARDWDATATVIHLISHNERDTDILTVEEAEQLAKNLRRCGAIVVFHQVDRQLAGVGG